MLSKLDRGVNLAPFIRAAPPQSGCGVTTTRWRKAITRDQGPGIETRGRVGRMVLRCGSGSMSKGHQRPRFRELSLARLPCPVRLSELAFVCQATGAGCSATRGLSDDPR